MNRSAMHTRYSINLITSYSTKYLVLDKGSNIYVVVVVVNDTGFTK